ncbi:senescence-specific cysteine protease SAG39-like protein, partial [Tanacetum coccineum]
FAFIVKNKGINNDAAYPYEAEDATCNTKEESIHAAKITRQEDVPAEYDFKFYSSGVFNGYCGFTLTHGVTAVGYGTSDDGMYWLVSSYFHDTVDLMLAILS